MALLLRFWHCVFCISSGCCLELLMQGFINKSPVAVRNITAVKLHEMFLDAHEYELENEILRVSY